MFFLMYIFQNRSYPVLVYTFMHSFYGICWVVKDIFFGDKTFRNKATFTSHFVLCLLLLAYWCIPIPLVIRYGLGNPSTSRVISILLLYFIGLFMMLGSDYQKNQTLKKKKGLISSGFFKYTRNPNYFG